MTELAKVDSANCPHCRTEIVGDELNAMETADSEEVVLVCPECETVLGGAMGDGMFAAVASTLLAKNLDEAQAVVEAMREILEADTPSDVDDESIELINERMGPTEVTIE
jgi:myo-inositol catabolism protein IolC